MALRDAWQQAQFDRELAQIADSAEWFRQLASRLDHRDGETPLLLADVRHLLAQPARRTPDALRTSGPAR